MPTHDSRSYQGKELGLPITGEYKWYAVREPKFRYYRKVQMACCQGAQILPHAFALKRKACVCYQWPIHELCIPCDSQLLCDEVILDTGTVSAFRMCLSLETVSFFCRFSQHVAIKHRPAVAAGAKEWLPFGFFFSVMLPPWDFSWQLWLQIILDFCSDLKTYCLHMGLLYIPSSSFVISSYQKNTIMC